MTVAIGVLLVGALFSDGWAHSNVPDLEGFFTPWHGALYLGFAASAAWIGWLGRPRGAGGWGRALPEGYRAGAAGVLVFALGGLLDMAWHLTLGVEVGVDALLSPSHLVLLIGGLLILTSPLRSRWAAGDTSSPTALGSLILASALGAFFLLYVSEFAAAAPTIPYERLPEGAPGHQEAELPALAGLGAFLVTTVVLAVPLLLIWQRDRAPRGAVVLLVGVLALLSATVVGFSSGALTGALGAIVGAALAEPAIRLVEGRHAVLESRSRLPALAAVTVLLVWAGHVAALAISPGLQWPAELWAGVVVLCSGLAALLGHLAGGHGAQATQRTRDPQLSV